MLDVDSAIGFLVERGLVGADEVLGGTVAARRFAAGIAICSSPRLPARESSSSSPRRAGSEQP